MPRLANSVLVLFAAAILIAGCGSSSSSSSTSTSTSSSAPTTSTSTPAANRTQNLPAVAGTRKGTLATFAHVKVRRRPQAHWAGLDGMSLAQKMVTISTSVASFWAPLFQGNQVPLPAATVTIVDQAPGTCGSNQIATTDVPQYCISSGAVFLPLAYFQNNIAPIGDAAVGLDISDLYGYHIENALGAFKDPNLTQADIRTIDSCFSGLYFGSIQQNLTPADAASVNKFIAATAPPAGQGAPGQVTADELTAAFNKGVLSNGNLSACLPASASSGGTSTTP